MFVLRKSCVTTISALIEINYFLKQAADNKGVFN